jgi:hypothetical protein
LYHVITDPELYFTAGHETSLIVFVGAVAYLIVRRPRHDDPGCPDPTAMAIMRCSCGLVAKPVSEISNVVIATGPRTGGCDGDVAVRDGGEDMRVLPA